MSDTNADWKESPRVSDEVWRAIVSGKIEQLEKSQKENSEALEKMEEKAMQFFNDYGNLLKEMLEQKARRQKFYAEAMQRCAVLGIWAAIIFLLNAVYMSVKAYLKQ